ncbi:hypothetical protein Poli38472_003944 [Pythium oligandrum]|uniref:RRM domain-containing protein n=1 Tax=Pythium oligandrum TaxID=41045 RepID=A0A8K1FMD9_PYTOL|nr:hypothetical protein Poli38472_003944 [Pythium oligandrum]|eukprot:TMW66179.1 hypothetical protein Poli38472_003944 [Pythium oligandrum]
MSKKIAAQLEKLRGEEWDSDSEHEQDATFENGGDFVDFEAKDDVEMESEEPKKKKATPARKAAAPAGGKTKLKESNVIYLGRIPHGFYEAQMRGFFEQFGTVSRLRLSRNKRSGKSKHYAFVQFEEPEVAQVVASTMNGYRLFDHVMTCHIIPVSAIHERMFVGANKTFKPLPWRAIARNQHNAERSYEQTVARNKRLVKKDNQKRKILQALGIKYDFPGYAAKAAPKQKHVVFT